jgi:hypothetical protein
MAKEPLNLKPKLVVFGSTMSKLGFFLSFHLERGRKMYKEEDGGR